MKKKITIFGRKVPVIAILIALLVIGTASAAVFTTYATLNGIVDIDSPIAVIDSDDDRIAIGGEGNLTFTGPAEFSVENSGTESATVYLVSTVREVVNGKVQEEATTDPVTVTFAVTSGGGTLENGALTISGSSTPTISVTVSSPPNVEGDYQVQVEINASASIS